MLNFYLKHCRQCFFKMGFLGWNDKIKDGDICKVLNSLLNCFVKGLCCPGMVRGDACLRLMFDISSIYFMAWLLIELGRTWTSTVRWEVTNPNTYWDHQVLQMSKVGWVGAGVNGSSDSSPPVIATRHCRKAVVDSMWPNLPVFQQKQETWVFTYNFPF